jgi:hypothetical protein
MVVIVKPLPNFATDVADSLRFSPPIIFSRTTIVLANQGNPPPPVLLHRMVQDWWGTGRLPTHRPDSGASCLDIFASSATIKRESDPILED